MMARWEGRISLLSTSEKARHRITIQAIAAATDEVAPACSSIGMKAMMVVNTPNVAGTATRCAPRTMFGSV